MIKYSAKITQNGASQAPTVIVIDSLYPAIIDWQWTGDGEYTGSCLDVSSNPCKIFNNNMPPKWFLNSNTGEKYAVSMVNLYQVILQVYDASGNPSNGALTGALVEFENSGLQ